MAPDDREEETGKELRLQILNTSAAEARIDNPEDGTRVWGLVVDWPVADQVATVMALADGSASLYTTSTFGVIGGREHERVRRAAMRLVDAANEQFENTTPASAYPYPNEEQVYFYFLTFEGVCAATADGEDIESGTDKLTSLFGLSQDVLTELRLIQEGGRAEAGEGEGGREWFGLPGYLNCLLTGMSRGMGESIEISADASLPNLDDLSAGHAKLHAWITAQEFDYGELAAPDLITLLKNSVRFRGLPFLARKGEIKTVHAAEDGTAQARVFDVVLARGGKSVRITMAGERDPRVVGLQVHADEQAAE